MQGRLIAAGVALWAGSAAAVNAPDIEVPYMGGAFVYELPDSARHSDDGIGAQLQFGLPLGPYGYPGFAAEITVHHLGRDRDATAGTSGGLLSPGEPGVPAGSDTQTGVLADLVYDFGDVGGAYTVRPFVLGGLGGVQNDVAGDSHIHFALNLGGGVLLPLPWYDFALRVEARALGQFDDQSTSDDQVLDLRVSMGLQIPLVWPTSSTAPAPKAEVRAQECELAIVDPITGRTQCGVDTDRDGVLDTDDQCPDSTAGMLVDTRGCAIASAPVAAAPVKLAGDEDGDTIADASDRCPSTRPGLRVDTTGCFITQSLSLGRDLFDGDTAVLTPTARRQLLDLAGMLKVQPDAYVVLAGVVTGAGDPNYRLKLAQQRVESVRQTLMARGVKEARIRVETGAGAPRSGRVELRLIVG